MSPARWSLKVGSVFGIPIRLHATFLLLVAWLVSWAASRGQDIGLWLVAFFLVFGSLLCHELGHAVAARLLGVRTREIVLYPVGGQARLESPPGGIAELIIALAGPLVSFVLFLLAFGTSVAAGARASGGASSTLLSVLQTANLLLSLINLTPAFPMDGGRALRGFLSFTLGEPLATRIASGVGQVLAVVVIVVALVAPAVDLSLRLGLVLLASFVLVGCQQELLLQRQWSRLRGRFAREAMMTRFLSVRPQDSLELVARLLLAGTQREFPVIDGWGRVAGIVDRSTLYSGLLEGGRQTAVLEVMRREVASVAPEAPLEEVVQRLHAGAGLVVVQHEQHPVGIITLEKLGQLVDLLETLERSPGERGARPAEEA